MVSEVPSNDYLQWLDYFIFVQNAKYEISLAEELDFGDDKCSWLLI